VVAEPVEIADELRLAKIDGMRQGNEKVLIQIWDVTQKKGAYLRNTYRLEKSPYFVPTKFYES
jgi:hypothetical protein